MKKAKVNTELRQWARGISFTIAMGRRQVYTLIQIYLSADRQYGTMMVGDRHRLVRHFITSAHCLIDRGLLIAPIWQDGKLRGKAGEHTYGELWRLTRAGELVIGLLKEAGIYDEVVTELEAADQPRLRVG